MQKKDAIGQNVEEGGAIGEVSRSDSGEFSHFFKGASVGFCPLSSPRSAPLLSFLLLNVLFDFEKDVVSRVASRKSAEYLVDEYLAEVRSFDKQSTEAIAFWCSKAEGSSLSALRQIALKSLCLPASSKDVERVFSVHFFILNLI